MADTPKPEEVTLKFFGVVAEAWETLRKNWRIYLRLAAVPLLLFIVLFSLSNYLFFTGGIERIEEWQRLQQTQMSQMYMPQMRQFQYNQQYTPQLQQLRQSQQFHNLQ